MQKHPSPIERGVQLTRYTDALPDGMTRQDQRYPILWALSSQLAHHIRSALTDILNTAIECVRSFPFEFKTIGVFIPPPEELRGNRSKETNKESPGDVGWGILKRTNEDPKLQEDRRDRGEAETWEESDHVLQPTSSGPLRQGKGKSGIR